MRPTATIEQPPVLWPRRAIYATLGVFFSFLAREAWVYEVPERYVEADYLLPVWQVVLPACAVLAFTQVRRSSPLWLAVTWVVFGVGTCTARAWQALSVVVDPDVEGIVRNQATYTTAIWVVLALLIAIGVSDRVRALPWQKSS